MVHTIDTAETFELLAGDVQVIDVREPSEFAAGHIERAINIPLETLRDDPEKFLIPGKPVLFICKKGVRSLAAAKLAERFGYERVYNLDGGMLEWIRVGLPTTDARVAA